MAAAMPADDAMDCNHTSSKSDSSVMMMEGDLRLHECRNLADKGDCMSYCVCKVSIVETSYESLEEELLDKIKFVSAPTYRHKLKLGKPHVWKQTQSKECSIHWSKHNQNAFRVSFNPNGTLRWAESKDRSGSAAGEDENRKDKGRRYRPRIKFEVYAVGSPSAPEEKFLGQTYLTWYDIAAKFNNKHSSPNSSSGKIFLQLKPRSFKSRVKGYFVLSFDPCVDKTEKTDTESCDHLNVAQSSIQNSSSSSSSSVVPSQLGIKRKSILKTISKTTYMKDMVLYCQVIKVENLPMSSRVSLLADPYVVLETMPNSRFSRSARTTTKFQKQHAAFMEAFLFESLRPEVQDLCVSVWDENTIEEDRCLGHVVIPFESIWHNMFNSTRHKQEVGGVQDKIQKYTMAFELQQRRKYHRDENSECIAYLSLWFGSRPETLAACKESKRGVAGNTGQAVFYEPELRTLHVEIIKAKNVPPKILKNGCVAGRDCYCTVEVSGCLQKNATQVQRSTLWPEFNEKFALMVAQNQLHKAHVGAQMNAPAGTGATDTEELMLKDDSGEGSASHRSGGAGFNNESLLKFFKKSGNESPILTIKLFEYDPLNQSLAGGDKCLGKIKVPVSNLPTSKHASVKPQWIPLISAKRKNQKYFNLVPELQLKACFDQDDMLPTEGSPPIGSVSITLKKIYLESSAATLASERGGLYCIVKYGRELVQTPCHEMKPSRRKGGGSSESFSQSTRSSISESNRTGRSGYNEYQFSSSISTYRSQATGRSEHDVYSNDDSLKVNELQIFHFGDRCVFPVSEPASLITVGIFDKGDMRLSKIQMKVSTFLSRSNKMLYPISVEMPDRGTRHVGYLEFCITIQYNSKIDLWQRYFTLTRPPIDYTDPLPWKIQYNVKLQSHDIVKACLSHGSNKLASNVVKDVLGSGDLKFSIKSIQTRFADLSESLKNLVPVDLTKIKLYDPLSWEKPVLSSVFVVAYCLVVQYAEYLLPVTFLLLVIAGLSLRKFQREIISYELSRLSDDDARDTKSLEGREHERLLKAGIKMDSPIVLDSKSSSPNIKEEGDSKFTIPDLESKDFRVDCFWQEYDVCPLGHEVEVEKDVKSGRVDSRMEILKLDVEDKFLTVKAKVGNKIRKFKMRMGDKVDGAKIKLEDRLEHINKALKAKFPHLKLRLSSKLSSKLAKSLRKNVKGAVSEVRQKAEKVKTKVGQAVSGVRSKAEGVIAKAGDAIDGVRGLARKEIESKLLAVRRRANFVILMDKYIQLKNQYEELKSYAGIFQMMLGDLNKCLRNLRGLIFWTDPRVSFFFVFGSFLFSIFLFWFGMKITLQLAGLYVLRPPCLRDPFPPLPLNPFFRMASLEESPLYIYLHSYKKDK